MGKQNRLPSPLGLLNCLMVIANFLILADVVLNVMQRKHVRQLHFKGENEGI